MRQSDALPVCRGERSPDTSDAVTCDDVEQASAAVLAALFKKGDRRGPPLCCLSCCSKRFIVAIDQYAEAATGNRDFFLNKPPGARQGNIP
jgi:hypothetical protein